MGGQARHEPVQRAHERGPSDRDPGKQRADHAQDCPPSHFPPRQHRQQRVQGKGQREIQNAQEQQNGAGRPMNGGAVGAVYPLPQSLACLTIYIFILMCILFY